MIIQNLKALQNIVAQPDESRYGMIFANFEHLIESLICIV